MPSKRSSSSTSSANAGGPASPEQILRAEATQIFRAALAAADPFAATLSHCKPLPQAVKKLYVIGAGKASALMAQAVEAAYGSRIEAGLIVTKSGHALPLKHIECLEASHPVPDEDGVEGARRIARMCLDAGPGDLVLCLISGGASALLPYPADPITLSEKQATTKLLLGCGATINELNCVRKHLSALKGGQLAHLAHPAHLKTLILSDVIGDPLDTIGSGPTVPDTTTFADAWEIIYKHGLETKLPSAVRRHLHQGVNHAIPETPKPGDPIFRRTSNVLIGSNRLSLQAAQKAARQLGYKPLLLSTTLDGEAKEVARFFAAMAREIRRSGHPAKPPVCLLAGGETTVNLTQHHGLGGRNMEMALGVAIGIENLPNTVFLSAGTDGSDGPTDAAGAFASGSTVPRAQALEFHAEQFLHRNDSYHFFQALDDLLVTGPTGTNVMDIQMLLLK
jgi:glycerate 2-kinase